MTTKLYKGAAPGTYWHTTDARLTGFKCSHGLPQIPGNAVRHIANGLSRQSPYVSFSTSYAIARDYALSLPASASSANSLPGYVYEIDLAAVAGVRPALVDPLHFITSAFNGRYAHHHQGAPVLIAEVAGGLPYTKARDLGGCDIVVAPSSELIALINAVRDAEILIADTVPASAIIARHDES